MSTGRAWGRFLLAGMLAVAVGLLAGCGGDDNHNGGNVVFKQGTLPGLTKNQVFDTNGQYDATIHWTTNGIPHIKANNLEDAAFGNGYAQAKDNICIIASEILKARSQRAQFLGPGPDNINIITDFSFKALDIMGVAREIYPKLSPASRALLQGFAAGYNQYLADTGSSNLPRRCAGKPWVRPITPQQMAGYLRIVALYASGDQFVKGITFMAAPPGKDYKPVPTTESGLRITNPVQSDYKAHYQPLDEAKMGSNGWGIGGKLTESGRGALLANPHFPYTGSRRFWLSQITVPGVMNIFGGSLIGFPLPQIGFNKDIAWTHTVSTANHFTVYLLHLKAGDPTSYMKDGKAVPMTSKTFKIKVKDEDTGQLETFKKTFYYSEYGPMINLNKATRGLLPKWGDKAALLGDVPVPVAFTYRDANIHTARVGFDQYLGMDRSQNLKQFQSIFKECGTTFWVNTIYADKQGNAFYLDSTSVPKLSDKAIQAFKKRLKNNPVSRIMYQRKVALLDGSTSRDDWVEGKCDVGLVPFSEAPKLRRDDFVQNSNDSYWATNPDHFLTGYSPLYGTVNTQLSRRTRMGLTMLTHPEDAGLSNVKPAGPDGKFSARDIIQMLYSDRAYMAETLLPDLLHRCSLIGSQKVAIPKPEKGPTPPPRSVALGCQALQNWNGTFTRKSTGAATFRVFMGHYSHNSIPADFKKQFDPAHPITTPGDPKPVDTSDVVHDPMLQALAEGLNDLDSVNIAYDAMLGKVQYERTSGDAPPGGTAQYTDQRIPWHGAQNLSGGFNVVVPITSDVATDTRYPIIVPKDVLDYTGNLSAKSGQGWMVDTGTSWHFGLEFKDSGPVAYGLLSYSQSTNPKSKHYNDQDRRYSNGDFRRIRYTKTQIMNDPNLVVKTIIANKPSD